MAPSRSTSPAAPTTGGTSHPHPHPNPLSHADVPPTKQPQSHQHDLPSSAPPLRSPSALKPDEQPVRRVSRKLQKKRRDGDHTPPMELPDRLQDHGDQADSEVVLQPQVMNMNQSIFGLIAAAGSQVDFTDRFEGQSSDEDEEGESAMTMTIAGHRGSLRRPEFLGGNSLAQTTILRKSPAAGAKGDGRHHRKKLSESRLLRSVPGLARLSSKSKSSKSPKGKSPIDHRIHEETEGEPATPGSATDSAAPSIEVTRAEGRLAPVMSRMLEARAQMAARPSFDLDRLSGEQARAGEAGEMGPTELAKKLKEIFEFDEPEEVIEEYPCWLLQHVLLQGYMYITARHIAFYAYLPKKANEVAKSGYLGKSGKRNPKYNRYWFRLKGDVLSYYRDPQNLYFPSGHIDLRYGISASITDKDKEATHFAVTTHHRTYHFRADSAQSAKEWVKSLQRVIFRSHNDGDSVKISLPIENVIDIEETQMLDFADTCKIRVIDNDETYAIDEYFFSFFSFGKEALNLLRILVEDSATQTPGKDKEVEGDELVSSNEIPSKQASRGGSRERAPKPAKIRTSKLSEGVRATLSPLSPGVRNASPSPRPSCDAPRSSFDALRPFGRRSLDLNQIANLRQESPRRSFSDSRHSLSKNRLGDSRVRPEKQGSSDSYVQSLEDPSQASISALVASGSSEDQSASQILRGSDVFHSPTVRRSASASKTRNDGSGVRSPEERHHSSELAKYSARHAATTGHIADPGAGELEGAPTTPTLQSIAKMGGYPFQKANAIMGYLDRTSRRMSTLLATESMGYVEKVSGMWKGGKKHYDDPSGLRTDEEEEEDAPEDRANSEARFKAHFALPETEKLQATYFGNLMRVLPLYGKIYIGDRHFCFRSLLPGTRTKLILPFKDIENADKEKGFRFGYAGLVVVIKGHEELFFEFNKAEIRDDCAITLIQNLEATRYLRDSSLLDRDELENAQAAAAERDALQEARHEEFTDHEVQLPRQTSGVSEAPTILFDDPKASFLNFKPTQPMRVTCLTIGSRGDVQPYIALCKKLLEEGHKPRIATHLEFKDWIEGHGIEFRNIGGDPSELMRICIQNGTFTWAFLREANSKFRGWLDDLLASSWEACQGSDLLIESPSAMAGIHIAEALGIPYFRAFTMPWTRTRAYPHAFIMPNQKMGGAYNYVTYVMFDNVFWKAMAHQVNKWRNTLLGLPSTNLEKLQINKVPFLYNFSPCVVPPPLDYSDWIRVTGYWFLDEGGDKWQPPADLMAFITKAREDGKKLVYVGFGSIIVPDPAKMTQEVIDAVLKADVRCILSKGWSERLGLSDDDAQAEKPGPVLPPEIFQIKSAPHDWLFKQIDAAAHHGGSGTTGASLRAGIPTIIRPFFGDQYFFASRVEDMGVGICLKKWGALSFGRALWEATHNTRMVAKAKALGEQIRKENGVEMAIQCIYRDLEYAKNLIKSKAGKNTARRNSVTAEGTNADIDDDDDVDEEESWTFVGADADLDDLSTEGVMRKTVADLRKSPIGPEGLSVGSRASDRGGSSLRVAA